MTDFEKYIEDNSSAFDVFDPREGDQERFLAKLDRRRRVRMISWVSTAAAAAVIAAVLVIPDRPAQTDRFAGIGDDPVAVYKEYNRQVASLYVKISSKYSDYNWESEIRCLSEEPVPMLEQLPEEMDDASKARILKDYYNKKLSGMETIDKKI